LYGRHAVRAYAGAVGVDAGALLDEVGPLLPAAEDPLDGLARLRGLVRRREVRLKADATSDRVRLKPDTASDRIRLKPDAARDCTHARTAAASAIDGAILAAIALVLFQLTALVSGLSVRDAAELAGPAVLALTLLIGLIYFVLLGGVRNATVGQVVAHARTDPLTDGGEGVAVVARGLHRALRESSIIVDLLVSRSPRADFVTHVEGSRLP
jgi:hypothetical protein